MSDTTDPTRSPTSPHIYYQPPIFYCTHCGVGQIVFYELRAIVAQQRCAAFMEQHKDCKSDRIVNPQDYP